MAASTIPYIGTLALHASAIMFLGTSALGTIAGYKLVAKPLIFIGKYSWETIKAVVAKVEELSKLAEKVTSFLGLTGKSKSREEQLQEEIVENQEKLDQNKKDQKASEEAQNVIKDNSGIEKENKEALKEVDGLIGDISELAKGIGALAKESGVQYEMVDGVMQVKISEQAKRELPAQLKKAAKEIDLDAIEAMIDGL